MSESEWGWWDDIEFSSPAPGVVAHTHAAHICTGSPCPLHNPSEHHMREWELVLIGRRALGGWPLRLLVLSERRCGHGRMHPDPDSLAYVTSHSTMTPGWWADHICCPERCCAQA